MKNTILILCFFLGFNLYAQDKEIMYLEKSGKILTESEYLKMKSGFLEKMENEGNEGELKEVITDSITKDIIYKKFSLSFISVTTNDVEHIDSFIKKKLPLTELQLLNANKTKFSDFEGKPTLLNFWFTKCIPCIAEIPGLEALKKKYGSKVNFVAVTFNNENEVKSFLLKREFNFEHIVDAQQFIQEIGLNTYPRNLLLDKNGIVQTIKDEIPSKIIKKNKKSELKFDLSDYEKIIDELLK